tara:strand:- start:748 stop:945 length:198 start_codon:yes stop_codon:yes gene_type:complete
LYWLLSVFKIALPHVRQVNVNAPTSYIWLLKSMVDDASREESSKPSFEKKADSLEVLLKHLLNEN